MTIENSTATDIDEIFRLYGIATAYMKSKNVVSWPEFDRGMVMTEIVENRQWKLLIDGKIACVWVTAYDDPQIWQERNIDPSVYIHRIATNPDFRGYHWVKNIVKWAKKHADEEGKEFIRMDTVGENHGLINHYGKCGFDFLGLLKLDNTDGLPGHYHNATVSLFQIALEKNTGKIEANKASLAETAPVAHRHFMIYKPIDYISQFINNKRRKKPTLGDLQDFPVGTMAIGRLDARSEGLLFLTTDGMESHKVRSKKVEKEYYVQVDGIPDDEAIEKLKNGVEIGFEGKKYMTLPCAARRLEEAPKLPPRGRKIREERHGPTSWVSVTLTEGKNRQVRKMTAAVGHPTLRLVRVRIADVCLGDMTIGEVREVDKFL